MNLGVILPGAVSGWIQGRRGDADQRGLRELIGRRPRPSLAWTTWRG